MQSTTRLIWKRIQKRPHHGLIKVGTFGLNGAAGIEEGDSKPDSTLNSNSKLAGAEAARVAMSTLGTSSTVSTSIGVDVEEGKVETIQTSTFIFLIGGAGGDAPEVDEPLFFERVLFFKTKGAD
ncbi:hypothetical protein AMTR_s00015p00237220 [Amborella trichopoda]|uniref:Uncharacterized protein n=1 Tax=Amborella trichopoda TaxID=13333 RepID=W1PFZ4_AMBTC|nr:hypothetical protein AMTR_s00015p00237220 [Amborella trichopoda]